jgi:Protein of unknown function (DUF3300)
MNVRRVAATTFALVLVIGAGVPHARALASAGQQQPATAPATAKPATTPAAAKPAPPPEAVDKLLAPIALYPDQLLAQLLLCAQTPAKVQELSGWLVRNKELQGTELQNAAQKAGFEPSFVVLALFPQVVNYMADNIAWTKELGQVFSANRQAVLDSVQRLRAQCQKTGNLKSTPQQQVETKKTSGGQDVIVIEPTNPQVVYVPQYNPQVVYTQPASTVVVVQEDDDDEAAAAAAGAVVGFAAGIAIGAAMDNDYYYGPYGWHGGPYMYNDAWDDFYDDREDAREDWYENREDAREDLQDNRENIAEERTERAGNAQEQRTERQETRSENRPESQAQRDERRSQAQSAAQARGTGTASAEARGTTGGQRQMTADRSGTRSDAFSGYSSGRSERAASSRGQRSRSGGGGRGRRR